MTSTLPPQEAGFYNKLVGTSALTALVSTRIHNGQAPEGTPFPYLIYNLADEGLPNDTPSMRTDSIFRVRSFATTRASAKAIADAAFTALHLQTLTVTGWDNYYTAVVGSRQLIETISGVQIWSYILDVNVRLSIPIVASTPTQTYSQMILSTFSDVYAIYPLNETGVATTAIETVNGYNGTLNGPTLAAIAGPGASMGNAAFYDGLVDYCQLPAASLDGPFDPNLGTMMIWMRVFNAGVWTDGTSRVLFTLGVNSTNRILLYRTATNNNFQFYMNAGGTVASRDIVISSTAWNCYGLTWNKTSNRIRAYLNGVQQGADLVYTGTWVGSLVNSQSQICATNGGFFWHGYPSFLVLSSAEATAAQMLAAATPA